MYIHNLTNQKMGVILFRERMRFTNFGILKAARRLSGILINQAYIVTTETLLTMRSYSMKINGIL